MKCYHLIFVGEAGVTCEWHDERETLGVSLIAVLPSPPIGDIIIDSLVYNSRETLSLHKIKGL